MDKPPHHITAPLSPRPPAPAAVPADPTPTTDAHNRQIGYRDLGCGSAIVGLDVPLLVFDDQQVGGAVVEHHL